MNGEGGVRGNNPDIKKDINGTDFWEELEKKGRVSRVSQGDGVGWKE